MIKVTDLHDRDLRSSILRISDYDPNLVEDVLLLFEPESVEELYRCLLWVAERCRSID